MQELISPAQSKTRVLALSVFAAIVGDRVLERRGFPAGFQLPFQLSIRYTAHPIDNIIRTGDFMTQFFKSVRVLLCALALSASVHAAAQAQAAATPTPTATPPSSFGGGRQLSLITKRGSFQSEFKSFDEALTAARGNSYNQTLKTGSEIIVMNARCADDIFGDKVTFSIYVLSYALGNDLSSLVRSYLDYRVANPKMSDSEVKQRQRALIDKIMKLLAIASPRKADCDAVAVALAFPSTEVLRLEVDDAQSPLIGAKINDGFLYDGLLQNQALMRTEQAKLRGFWGKFGYNRFSTLQDALNVAGIFAGTKVIIHNGTNFSIYPLGDFQTNSLKSDAQFDVFKTTPIRKGWKIMAIVVGKKLIKVNDPNVKK